MAPQGGCGRGGRARRVPRGRAPRPAGVRRSAPAGRSVRPPSPPAPIGVISWSSIGPVSSPSSRRKIVMPVQASPQRIAAVTGEAPRWRGSRLAWTFQQPRGASSSSDGRRIRPKAAVTRDRGELAKRSRASPAAWSFGGWKTGMPATRARGARPADPPTREPAPLRPRGAGSPGRPPACGPSDAWPPAPSPRSRACRRRERACPPTRDPPATGRGWPRYFCDDPGDRALGDLDLHVVVDLQHHVSSFRPRIWP